MSLPQSYKGADGLWYVGWDMAKDEPMHNDDAAPPMFPDPGPDALTAMKKPSYPGEPHYTNTPLTGAGPKGPMIDPEVLKKMMGGELPPYQATPLKDYGPSDIMQAAKAAKEAKAKKLAEKLAEFEKQAKAHTAATAAQELKELLASPSGTSSTLALSVTATDLVKKYGSIPTALTAILDEHESHCPQEWLGLLGQWAMVRAVRLMTTMLQTPPKPSLDILGTVQSIQAACTAGLLTPEQAGALVQQLLAKHMNLTVQELHELKLTAGINPAAYEQELVQELAETL